MIYDFKDLELSPLIISYSGKGIEGIVKKSLGIIREIYFNPNDPPWKNILHASESKEVKENMEVLKKYNLI